MGCALRQGSLALRGGREQGSRAQAGFRKVYKEFLVGGLVGKYGVRFPYMVVFFRFSIFSGSCFFVLFCFVLG